MWGVGPVPNHNTTIALNKCECTVRRAWKLESRKPASLRWEVSAPASRFQSVSAPSTTATVRARAKSHCFGATPCHMTIKSTLDTATQERNVGRAEALIDISAVS